MKQMLLCKAGLPLYIFAAVYVSLHHNVHFSSIIPVHGFIHASRLYIVPLGFLPPLRIIPVNKMGHKPIENHD
jgi:hypothetical protein